ncbi:MAG: hypothetical protein ACFFAS_19530 [Promethearchaeota archaeon]
MNLNTAYEKLYKQWLQEFQFIELTPLTPEIFEEYQRNRDSFIDLKVNPENKIRSNLTQAYKQNFNFLLTDLMKMREIKLINRALANQEIDYDGVIEAEKLLFQNLVASFKGFDKMKKISVKKYVDVSFINKESEIQKKLERLDLEVEEKIDGIEPEQVKQEKFFKNHTQEGATQSFSLKENVKEDYNYVVIRFLKKTPPVVGIDLINYGPYEKEDIAAIPLKNARILVDEKYAELIEL